MLHYLVLQKWIDYLFALVLHSEGLKISKCKNVCPEWLRWGLGNCERVGKSHCVEMLNCRGNTLVQVMMMIIIIIWI